MALRRAHKLNKQAQQADLLTWGQELRLHCLSHSCVWSPAVPTLDEPRICFPLMLPIHAYVCFNLSDSVSLTFHLLQGNVFKSTWTFPGSLMTTGSQIRPWPELGIQSPGHLASPCPQEVFLFCSHFPFLYALPSPRYSLCCFLSALLLYSYCSGLGCPFPRSLPWLIWLHQPCFIVLPQCPLLILFEPGLACIFHVSD